MPRWAVDGSALQRLRAYLLLLLAAGSLVGGYLGARYYLSLPTLGFSFGSGDQVAGVDPDGSAGRAGMSVGDRVVTINGVSPLAGEPNVRPGQQSVALEVERAGQILALTIVPIPLSPWDIVGRIGYLFTASAFWAMAALLLGLKPHDATAQVLIFGLLLAAASFVILLLADVGLGWASLLMNAMVLTLGLILVYLHTIFPERLDFRGRKVLLCVLYSAAVLLFLAAGLARFTHRFEWSTPAINASRAFFVACLLLAVGLSVRTHSLSRSRITRRQIGFVGLGTALAVLPLVIFILLPQILPNLRYLTIWPAFLALVFIPASYLYAIFRLDLMRLDWVVSQNVAKILHFLLLVVLYLAVYWLLRLLAPPALLIIADATTRTILTSIALILVLTASFQPLKRGTERFVHQLFYGAWYDYKSFVSRMTRAFSGALDMQTVVDLLIEQVAGTMRLKAIALLLPASEGEDCYAVKSQKGFESPMLPRQSEALPGLLQEAQGPVEHRTLSGRAQAGETAQQELAAWAAAGVQWWVPLVEQGKLEGVLVLGAKMADEFLTGEDLDILDTLSHHVASAIARVRLLKQLHDQVHEIQSLSRKLLSLQDEIQEEIALEIHAEAMPNIVNVNRLLEEARYQFVPDRVNSAREELQQLLDYLRALMYDLRPPVLSLTDLGEMLRQHALSCQRRWDLPIAVHAGEDSADVPAEIRTAVFRVFQESLNNAWHHAQARHVEATLDLTPDRLRLEIRDDGVGFVVPRNLGDLANGEHSGLLRVRERIEAVGGQWMVESQPGQGTRVVAEVPLPTAQSTEGTE